VNGERVNRLRMWLLALTVVVVFGAISAPIIISAFVSSASDETQLEVGCQIVRSQNVQLAALASIRHELGLPGRLIIPEVPAECDGI
jgi:Na+/pantothenate symporter